MEAPSVVTLSVRHTFQYFLRKSPPSGSELFECHAATGLEGEDPNWRSPSGWSAPRSPRAVTAISRSYAMNTRVGLAVVKRKHREANDRYCEPRDDRDHGAQRHGRHRPICHHGP